MQNPRIVQIPKPYEAWEYCIGSWICLL